MARYLITVFRKGNKKVWTKEFEANAENEERVVQEATKLVLYAARNHATWVACIHLYRLEGEKRVPIAPTWLAMVEVINKLKHPQRW